MHVICVHYSFSFLCAFVMYMMTVSRSSSEAKMRTVNTPGLKSDQINTSTNCVTVSSTASMSASVS